MHLAEIAKRIEDEVHITVSIGLAYNRFLAKLRGYSVIGRAGVKAFLAPLSVRKINGVGDVTAKRMEADDITTIGHLQALTPDQLVKHYGKFGRRLALYAQGEGSRKISTHREAKSISAETTFARNTASETELCDTVRPLCDRVAQRLAKSNLAGGTLVLKMKTHDFQTLTRNQKLTDPTQLAEVIYETAAQLIKREADGRAFRLIGVGVSDIRPAAEADPPDLFAGLG